MFGFYFACDELEFAVAETESHGVHHFAARLHGDLQLDLELAPRFLTLEIGESTIDQIHGVHLGGSEGEELLEFRAYGREKDKMGETRIGGITVCANEPIDRSSARDRRERIVAG